MKIFLKQSSYEIPAHCLQARVTLKILENKCNAQNIKEKS